ncbi:Ldh family oxidoreductase [Arthrobacter sp. H20]|uniref:Ldh family oxidoreductase n=1 Tax=Arthrobacter sp. H20 TaxID=1267981 RepID=UPI00047DFC59|nr:Ldh family oxidoreductase [Arthrobacter sp. H20]
MQTRPTFSVPDLRQLAAVALECCNVPRTDAKLTARSLVQADQRGIHSHGLLRLPLYVEALRLGGINPRPNLSYSSKADSVAILDADAALGQVAMQSAVDKVIEIGQIHGISAVAVQNSSHYGAGAFWSDQLAAAGFLSFITSSTGPVVAPHGGTTKVLGTNPLTLGAPGSSGWPLTADLATSNGAYGKVIAARNEGQQLPEGWAVDTDGNPTTDPEAAAAGSMIPFGDHKGSAVSVLLEAFASSLTDATYAYETIDIWSNPASLMNNGHLVIGINTDAFAGRSHTEARVADLQKRVRDSGPAERTVQAPGDPEHALEMGATSSVHLPNSTADQLRQLAHELSIPTNL